MLSAFVNVFGMLVATRGYTTAHLLEEQQPSVFSFPSVLLVQLWGLAFLATASRFEHNAIMCATFVAEKVRPQWRLPVLVWFRPTCLCVLSYPQVLYTLCWLSYMSREETDLAALWRRDWLTGLFFTVYGINDFFFAVVFGIALIVAINTPTRVRGD